ncbi:hypothetical protein [Tenacibaculum sp.]|uniref:hypothetical protein n=1 Tax=Tenacibaculum sp. TaxID=1906242 RepID=UPI003D0A7ADC
MYLHSLSENRKLFEEGKYTFGIVTNIKSMKGGLIYCYDFKVEGIVYKGEMRSGRYKKIGDRCFVIFSSQDCARNKMLLKLPLVPDSIKKAPFSPWDKLPIDIDKKELIRAINGG